MIYHKQKKFISLKEKISEVYNFFSNLKNIRYKNIDKVKIFEDTRKFNYIFLKYFIYLLNTFYIQYHHLMNFLWVDLLADISFALCDLFLRNGHT